MHFSNEILLQPAAYLLMQYFVISNNEMRMHFSREEKTTLLQVHSTKSPLRPHIAFNGKYIQFFLSEHYDASGESMLQNNNKRNVPSLFLMPCVFTVT